MHLRIFSLERVLTRCPKRWAVAPSACQCLECCGFGLYTLKGIHGEVAPERPLLAAPQSYLLISVAKVLALVSFGKTPTTLVLLLISLKSRSKHIRRA